MDHVDEDIKKAIAVAEEFLSVALSREPLSPATEKERSLLAEWFKRLKIQLNVHSELTDDDKPPPRPVKGGIQVPKPVADQENERSSEDIYDDIAGADAVEKQDEYYSEMAEGVEVEPKVANQPFPVEDYEEMSMAENGDSKVSGSLLVANNTQEDYEEPQQNQANEDYEIAVDQHPPMEEENYEVTDAATETYEETEPSPPLAMGSPMEEDYEGVDGGLPFTGEYGANGSHTTKSIDWENLTKNVKPGDIDGIISRGTLWKHRKKGKMFVGSRYQKRFCVLRSFVLYYFKEKSSDKQQGQILLPGYKVEAANKRGREFTLTREGDREFKFYASSKEEAEKWMKAIQSAANVPISVRHSATLDEIRGKQPSGDDDSMFYEDVASSAAPHQLEETTEQKGDDVYDDNVDENLYEAVGVGSAQEISYEISEPQASGSTVEPIQEDNYEVPEDEQAPVLPPPRPFKPQQLPEEDENYEIAEEEQKPPPWQPPRPSKPSPQLEQEETYEIAEEQKPPIPRPPPPSKERQKQEEEENYEIAEEPKAATPPHLPPFKPPPQPAQKDECKTPDHAPPLPPILQEDTPVAPPRPQKRVPPSTPQQKAIPEQPKRPAPKHSDRETKEPAMEQNTVINYANVYQALWNCEADDDDELAFQRGDLIYIYEKPHSDWWIGSLFKPQGNCVGLVPKQYVMEAYQIRA